MFGFKKRQNTNQLTLQTLTLQGKKVTVPVADITGKKLGRTMLVTAGMDGDEYAGVEAAYSLIETYKGGDFAGRLVIVPIVNVPGFEHETSHNPLDGKYPKRVFPGSPTGTATEQLVDWLAKTYACKAGAWIDLHGGSLTETLRPSIWIEQTSNAPLETLAKNFLGKSGDHTIVRESSRRKSQTQQLAHHGCLYILAESGCFGTRLAEDIAQHEFWVTLLMQEMAMLPATATHQHTAQTVVHTITTLTAPWTGIFRPRATTHTVQKGELLGQLSTYDAAKTVQIYSPATGIIVWQKITMAARKHDVLYGIGH